MKQLHRGICRRITRNVIALSMLVLAWPASAAVIKDLYQVDVPVATYSTADRNKAARTALQQVLTRTTPQTNGKLPTALTPALNRAPDLLQGYRYLEQEDDLKLRLSFSAQSVQQILSDAQLPFWGARRPNVLLWTALRNNGDRQIVSDLEASELSDAVRQAAKRRGLPIQLPLMDLTDSQQVFFTDVWARFDNVIEPASERYPVDGYAVLRISPGSGSNSGWQGDWLLSEQDRTARGSVAAATAAETTEKLVEAVADEMTRRYALQLEGGDDRERLLLSGITSMPQLVEASRALTALSAVSSVEVLEVSDTGIVLGVQVIGGREGLQQAMRLERRFMPKEQAQEASLSLNYQWTP